MIIAYRLQGEVLVWLIGAMLCLLAANRGSNCSFTREMDGRINTLTILACQKILFMLVYNNNIA